MIEGHGDDLYHFNGLISSNFSSNVPNGVDHSALIAHLSGCQAIISSYPEPEPYSLQALIADYEHVTPDSVLVTNGATEAIYLIASLYRSHTSRIITPTFREYEDACKINGHTILTSNNLHDQNFDLLWICCPNNPTGNVAWPTAFKPSRLTIIDASYSAFSTVPTPSASSVVNTTDTLMINSLTKRFAVPGLRVGYVVGHKSLIDKLRAIRMPWSVNGIAIEAAKWLILNKNLYPLDCKALNEEALRVSEEFNAIGIETMPTFCNFLTAKLPHGLSAKQLKDTLASRFGLLIRDASNFTGLTPSHFRIAVQSPEEDNNLISAIASTIC
ncbi:MAG: aminotransferase class I/II-fold pyridoxal phosphate-dependent enzyme [Paramuribaculum sp.]|nr:aminotransferase class I/II-fold pyridoxal phosphate-dependent enzyme [Paramuribaculum sp.]